MYNIATTGQDWANHISHIADSNACLQIIAKLDGRVDSGILRKAVDATIRQQPVLGCYFDAAGESPVWTPFPDMDTRLWFSEVSGLNADEDIRKFVEELSLQDGQVILVRLIHSAQGDSLCIKLDHACCDGGGAKAYLLLLFEVYNSLLTEPPAAFDDKAHTAEMDRSARKVFAACGFGDIRQAYRPEKNIPVPSGTFPFLSQSSGQPRYEIITIPVSGLRTRKKGVTVNDLIITAYMRTTAELSASAGENREEGESRQAVNVTVDLRRYLEQESIPAIRNLSGMERVYRSVGKGEGFDETLDMVHAQMQEIKSSCPGLHSAASMEFLSHMGYEKARGFLLQASSQAKLSGKSVPILSNLGFISREKLNLGGIEASEIFAVTPGMHAPAFMLGVSSYVENITLVVTYFEKEHTPGDIRCFLGRMKDQLCCL